MQINDELNELLVETFNIILKNEEKSLKRNGKVDLSISEFHLVETLAKCGAGQNTVSNIAAALNISLPSVTIAVKKLEQKGYVEKIKSPTDGRSVSVALTEKGIEVDKYHQKFHAHMVKRITAQMDDDEKALLYKVILKLNEFFKRTLL